MKYQHVANQYNDIYADDERAFFGEPLPLLSTILAHRTSGRVLEIGAGAGQNSIFLASKGFQVLATDISSVAIEKIKMRARDANVKLDTRICDIAEMDFTQDFDIIICAFTLHHLQSTDAKMVLLNIQKHTTQTGLNLLMVFTEESDLFRNHLTRDRFFVKSKKDINEFYANWTMLKSFEKSSLSRSLDSKGNSQVNTFVGLLAQKGYSD